jgi:hypothetical protein
VIAPRLAKSGKPGPNRHPHAYSLPPFGQPKEKAFSAECYLAAVVPAYDGLRMEGSRNNSMEVISHMLTTTGRLDDPSVNQTGLTGNHAFTVGRLSAASRVLTAATAPEPQGVNFLKALPEQAGMNIVSARACPNSSSSTTSRGPRRITVVRHAVERMSSCMDRRRLRPYVQGGCGRPAKPNRPERHRAFDLHCSSGAA